MNRLFLFASVVASCLCSGAAIAQEKLRLSSSFASGQSSSVSMREVFQKQLAELTGGKLTADLFPDNQLGGVAEGVDGVRSGAIFGHWLSTSYLTRIVPEMEALSIPFLFVDRSVAFRVIDGPIGDLLVKKMRDKGFEVLGWMELGHRHVTNSKREIKSIDDLKGLKIRLQPNEVHLATFRALGANPLAMDVKELYSALQQGVVDGQENPFTVIAANRYQEVQKYLSTTGHFFEYVIVIANKAQYDALPTPHREAIGKAMAAAVSDQRSKAAASAEAARTELASKGITVYDVPAPMLAAMRERTAPIADDVRKRAGAGFVKDVLDAVAK